jgi:CheY-like chemotaxis protein
MTHVLFVDDDRVSLKLVRGILEGAGYGVHTSTDPREALELMAKEKVDIVISDANMPGGISGFEFVRTIRMRPEFKDLPVALLTGRREKRDIQMGLQSGADDYIIKPIDPLVLLGKIETLLKKKPFASTQGTVPTVNGTVPPVNHGATISVDRPVRLAATWDMETVIVQASDRGLTLWSSLTAAVDTRVKVKSEFFARVGIEPPMLRIIGFTRDPAQVAKYYINTTFENISDSDVQKLRAWIATTTPKAS